MGIFSIYVLSKSGGLIYQYDHFSVKDEIEKTFAYPLEFKFAEVNRNLTVTFGQKDGVSAGHILLNVNGRPVTDSQLEDGTNVQEFLENPSNFPVTLKFGKSKLTTNDKIRLASTFYSLFAIASQLSPVDKSSGIEVIEADIFKLHCYQTLTGIKFLIIADQKESDVEVLLRKLHELYADYALKNPFYSLEMPIRCELFDQGIKLLIKESENL